jgi:hypothetical protein
MKSFYTDELSKIPVLSENIQILSIEETQNNFQWLEMQFDIFWGKINWSKVPKSVSVDIRRWTSSDLSQYLSSLDLPGSSSTCCVVWSDSDIGIKISFTLICQFIDEFIYPGKSDIWIVDKNKNFCLEVTHDEILSYTFLL